MKCLAEQGYVTRVLHVVCFTTLYVDSHLVL